MPASNGPGVVRLHDDRGRLRPEVLLDLDQVARPA